MIRFGFLNITCEIGDVPYTQIDQSRAVTIKKDLGPSQSILPPFSGFCKHRPEHGA